MLSTDVVLSFDIYQSKIVHCSHFNERCIKKASNKIKDKKTVLGEHFLQIQSLLIFIQIFVLPEEDRAAPDEDTDMDLVADREVLLSLPVQERQFIDWTTKLESFWLISPVIEAVIEVTKTFRQLYELSSENHFRQK